MHQQVFNSKHHSILCIASQSFRLILKTRMSQRQSIYHNQPSQSVYSFLREALQASTQLLSFPFINFKVSFISLRYYFLGPPLRPCFPSYRTQIFRSFFHLFSKINVMISEATFVVELTYQSHLNANKVLFSTRNSELCSRDRILLPPFYIPILYCYK